jgi:hypothetical protein
MDFTRTIAIYACRRSCLHLLFVTTAMDPMGTELNPGTLVGDGSPDRQVEDDCVNS